MDKYKISQTPEKNKGLDPKKFWVPEAQRKRIKKQTIVRNVIIATFIIVLGVGVASLKLRNKPIPHSQAPNQPNTTVAESANSSSIYSVPAKTFSDVTQAIIADDPSLLGKYFASLVRVDIPGSSVNEIVSGDDVSSIISGGLNGATNPWNFHLPESDISDWQTGPYGQYFDGIDIVGESSNGDVISIGLSNNGQINSILIVPITVLDPGSGSDSGPTQTPSQTPTPTPLAPSNAD
jgi:hypothetical protein